MSIIPTPIAFPAAAGTVPVTVQPGTAYTLAITDSGSVVDCTNAAAVTVTVPPASSVAWPAGTIINVCCEGAAGVTIAAGGGVTIQGNAAALTQWEEASLRYDGANQWVRVG